LSLLSLLSLLVTGCDLLIGDQNELRAFSLVN
jgi:hypothetical protein